MAGLGGIIVGVLTAFITLAASVHVVLHKRDNRAAVGWVGMVWLVPIVGAVLYILFGINRIRRRASALREAVPRPGPSGSRFDSVLDGALTPLDRHLRPLGELVDRVTDRPLLAGNSVTPLINGDAAYPAMLRAIREARSYVALATYIFDNDEVGKAFVEALEQAVARGVEVRVMIDGVGSRYSYPSVVRALKRRGVPVARFLPTFVPWWTWYVNLRNHKKLLLVDGRLGFTGGLNIRAGHVLESRPRHPVQDLHFQVEGPVLGQLREDFASDWSFATQERLEVAPWLASACEAGSVAARVITDGPDEDFERLSWVLHGAVGAARRTVRILTPYFLPERDLIRALNTAALRGVRVEILLPEHNNIVLIQWATTALLWQLLEHGCHVYLSPPPFDHAKLLLVDGAWALIGSANWDPRSLRLNFELNLECYATGLVKQLEDLFAERRTRAREVALEEVDGRSIPVRLRDNLARLLSPYL